MSAGGKPCPVDHHWNFHHTVIYDGDVDTERLCKVVGNADAIQQPAAISLLTR
jgi:hypothetical protein